MQKLSLEAPQTISAVYCQKKQQTINIATCKDCPDFSEIKQLKSEFAPHVYCKTHYHSNYRYDYHIIFKMWLCPYCNEPIKQNNYAHLTPCFQSLHTQEIERDYKIAKDRTNKKRANAAIYRLYKNYNIAPYTIAKQIGCSDHVVNTAIGTTFRHLCENDETCVFRSILKGETQ